MLGLSLSLQLRPQQRLTTEQRHLIQATLLETWGDLIYALNLEDYRPLELVCINCKYTLRAPEILKGFSSDPTDTTTACPRCHVRTQPFLGARSDIGTATVFFFCAAQTLDALQGMKHFSPAIIAKDASVYRSAIFHFGGLSQAFSEIGVKYQEESFDGWMEKIQPFLGRLPDTKIAKALNKPVNFVRSLRKKLGIRKFSKARLLEELS